MYTNILIAVDGSEPADRATQHGIHLAKAIGAKVTFVSAIRPWHTVAPVEVMVAIPDAEYLKGATEYAQSLLEKAEASAKESDVTCETSVICKNDPWQAITEAAKEHNCDLIVMGSHGRRGLTKLLLGSETQKVLTHTTIPVLVHR